MFDAEAANNRVSYSGDGSVMPPDEIPLHALVDVDGLLAHYKHLSAFMGSTISALLYDENGPLPLAEGREMIWYGPPLCQEIGLQGGDCLNRHWANAIRAMKSGQPTKACCVCGEKVLLSCPVILNYGGRSWPKACITFSQLSSGSLRPARTLARNKTLPFHRAEELTQQTLKMLRSTDTLPALPGALTALVDRTSREISVTYAYHRTARRTRASEESLRYEKRKLQILTDCLGVKAYVLNRDFDIVWFTAPGERGGAERDPVGIKCYQYRWSRDTVCESCPVVVAFDTGMSQTSVREGVSENGQRIVSHVKTAPILDDSGAISGAMVVSQEVTAQVKAREDVERYRNLVDNVSDVVVMIDEDGCLLAVNRRAPAVLGYKENDLLQMDVEQLSPDISEIRRLGEVARDAGSSVGEIRLRTKNGREIPFEASIVYSPKSRTYQAVCRDITERKRLREDMQRRTARLEEQHNKLVIATEEKASFFTGVSHELRTPMTSIVGFTELLLDDIEDPVSPGQRELLLKVSQNAHRLLGMINDLLDLSRVESGRATTNIAQVNLRRLLEQIVANMKPLVKDKSLQLSVSVESEEQTVHTDEQKLGQILVNLLSNAIKFTPSGRVEVRAEVINGKFKIAVSDTGIGIRRTDIPHIFEEFHTGEESLKHKIPGTGLGLAITRKLARLLGGSVSVKSAVGKGSTFTVSLPNRRPKNPVA